VLLLASLGSLSKRWPVSLPFFIAAVLIAANVLFSTAIRKRASEAIEEMFGKVRRGDPEARSEHFVSVAMWTGDAGSAFVSIAGLVAASILLLRDAGSAGTVLYAVVVVAVLAPLAIWGLVLLKTPKEYSRGSISLFQVVLACANVLLGAAVLAVG
jgi:hypothetical protein